MSSKLFGLLIEDLRELNSFADNGYELSKGNYAIFQNKIRDKTRIIERLCMALLEENAEIMSNMEQAHRALRDATYHDFMVRRDGPLLEPYDVMIVGNEKIKIDLLHSHILGLMEEGFTSFRSYLEKKDE